MTVTASTSRPQAARRSAHPGSRFVGPAAGRSLLLAYLLAEADDNFRISSLRPPKAVPRRIDHCLQDFGNVKVSNHHHRLMKNG